MIKDLKNKEMYVVFVRQIFLVVGERFTLITTIKQTNQEVCFATTAI
jgi:hypothetical protein